MNTYRERLATYPEIVKNDIQFMSALRGVITGAVAATAIDLLQKNPGAPGVSMMLGAGVGLAVAAAADALGGPDDGGILG